MKYIEMETSAPKIDEDRIVGAYEDALLHFDKENIGKIWIDPFFIINKAKTESFNLDLLLSYIDFKYSRSNKKSDGIAGLYWRAMKQLDSDLVDLFTQRFHMLKISLEGICSSNDDDVDMK